MKSEERNAIIEEDFGFLKDITVHEVDGKLMLGNTDLPFNVAVVLREDQFVREWMMPFALGNDLGINYFNMPKWHEMTNRGTQAAMVVDDEDRPVLLIRPLVSHNLTPADFDLLRNVSRHIQQVQADTYRSQDPNASMSAASAVKTHLQAKRLTITELVSPEFYEKHGVIPEVEKKVYFIKDSINRGQAKIEDINKSREILYRDHRKQKVTAEEYLFLSELSQGRFIIDDKLTRQEAAQAQGVETPNDPFEC